MEHQIYCSIFLFINSGSGGGVGQKLVAQQVLSFLIKIQKMSFTLNLKDITGNEENEIHVYFYNMRKNKQKGFAKLKALTDQNKKTIAVVCGGDGTVMWVVNQLVKHKIDLQKAPISVIPLGTGNDFSRCLGWGKQQITLTENSFETLKKLIKDWLEAEQQDLDIWHMHAKVYPHGAFYKIAEQKDKEMEGKVISKSFCNYFSFGIDGKVGYEFDKYRTTSRLGNLAVYGAMGIFSNFQKIKTVGELLEFILDESDGKVEIIYHGDKGKTVQQMFGNNIFDLKIDWNDVVNNFNYAFSLNNFQNIVALNINSYMGGVKDIWKKASEVELMKKSNHPPLQSTHSDSKIELVSFASTLSIGMEKAINKFSQMGFSQKVWQGHGPFRFKFRLEPNQKTENVTYLQIDGQFIKVNHLDEIVLKLSDEVPGGKISVLKRKGQPL